MPLLVVFTLKEIMMTFLWLGQHGLNLAYMKLHWDFRHACRKVAEGSGQQGLVQDICIDTDTQNGGCLSQYRKQLTGHNYMKLHCNFALAQGKQNTTIGIVTVCLADGPRPTCRNSAFRGACDGR